MVLNRISPRFVERPWGTTHLAPWFPDSDRAIGEVWFQGQSRLLVKFIFTAKDLSVQVHPADDYARLHHNGSNGKTEMWHILRASPGARLALGLKQRITRTELRAAAESGELVSLLNWIPARAGDTHYCPAGEVHAIGANLVVCEIQQVSDITCRLYDYGSQRELHLTHAVEVANLEAFRPEPQPSDGLLLVRSSYFHTGLMRASAGGEATAVAPPYNAENPWMLICTLGEGVVSGNKYRLGDVFEVPGGTRSLAVEPSRDSNFLITYQP